MKINYLLVISDEFLICKKLISEIDILTLNLVMKIELFSNFKMFIEYNPFSRQVF